jgi:hypothetical protein
MEQDMTSMERRRVRSDALEFAIRSKNSDDTFEDILAGAKLFGAFLAGYQVASPSEGSAVAAEREALALLGRAAETGNWGNLPEQLAALRFKVMAES